MGGVYCPRCETQVNLEQDGRCCSNCGEALVAPLLRSSELTQEAATKPVRKRSKRATKKLTRSAA